MLTQPDTTGRSLEFWFEFGSNYSYLAAMRIEALARQAGVIVLWRPFLLGPVFRQLGYSSSPFVLQEAKGRYMWRDMERQAAKHGLAWRRPAAFPRSAVLPMRVAVLGAGAPWIGAFCRRVMTQNWVEDREIDDAAAVREALAGLVPDADAVLAAALEPDNKLRLRANTEAAAARGIFGAPTFFVGDEMFWGNDRLDDAIALAAATPY
ncbi:2-hydroxychromene-2-carboxylate isomerase [Massilia sp. Leaf139]|uniref:2-hydroxychromene-2-carboxylate isomerase n=1 Tax=Massilia sp. Leaf139 TaxID=1736272 RepID=UPI0006F254ED|nr:2-hydroxychromene-2-carboxylate isomerase [Massilia sp. Leaf139]KQQ89235.1 disulfide bond formation protein DsbA [Massilia sp. Leaf139]